MHGRLRIWGRHTIVHDRRCRQVRGTSTCIQCTQAWSAYLGDRTEPRSPSPSALFCVCAVACMRGHTSAWGRGRWERVCHCMVSVQSTPCTSVGPCRRLSVSAGAAAQTSPSSPAVIKMQVHVDIDAGVCASSVAMATTWQSTAALSACTPTRLWALSRVRARAPSNGGSSEGETRTRV